MVKASLLRGLHYRRVVYRPGFGVCRCEVCSAAYEASRETAEPPDMGAAVAGCLYRNREQAFADQWAHEHRIGDLAQELMVRPPKKGERRSPFGFDGVLAFWLTYRERVILATVVQWLGSNVGFDFLRQALARCGCEIVEKDAAAKRRSA